MNKLIVLVGPIAAGKTTYAEQLTSANPEKVIKLDRDDLRTMFNNYKAKPRKIESVVSDAMFHIAENALSEGLDVVIADTNIYRQTREKWEALAIACQATYQEHWLDIDLKTSIERNASRPRVAPINSLIGYYKQYLHARYPEWINEEVVAHWRAEKEIAGVGVAGNWYTNGQETVQVEGYAPHIGLVVLSTGRVLGLEFFDEYNKTDAPVRKKAHEYRFNENEPINPKIPWDSWYGDSEIFEEN